MSIALITCTLTHRSGLPRDNVTNTFCFEWPGEWDNTKADQAILSINNFWNQPVTEAGGLALAKNIGEAISRAAGSVKCNAYDITNKLHGEPHGAPRYSSAFVLVPETASTNDFPSEVSLVGSFHAAYDFMSEEVGETRPKARRRGRVYIGPLNQSQTTQDSTSGRMKPSTTMINCLMGAMKAMMNDPATNWCQWSRSNGLALSVVGGHVDDSYDTRRSRGEDAVTRVTFGV